MLLLSVDNSIVERILPKTVKSLKHWDPHKNKLPDETVFAAMVDDIKKAFYLKHFLNFTLFFTSSIFFYKILKNRFSSFSVSFIGTLFFILSPRIYGSSFF